MIRPALASNRTGPARASGDGAVQWGVTTTRPATTETVTRHLPIRARALTGQSLVVTARRPLRDAVKAAKKTR